MDHATRRLSHRLARALAGAALLPVLCAQSAAAAPAYPHGCTVTTYYATAAMRTVVGTRTTCPGGHPTGRTSPYREVDTLEFDQPHHTSPAPGTPCDLDPDPSCWNLPH
jgi:hypothetical protein